MLHNDDSECLYILFMYTLPRLLLLLYIYRGYTRLYSKSGYNYDYIYYYISRDIDSSKF